MAQQLTFTIASRGCSIFGSGTFSTRTSSLPYQHSALMDSFCFKGSCLVAHASQEREPIRRCRPKPAVYINSQLAAEAVWRNRGLPMLTRKQSVRRCYVQPAASASPTFRRTAETFVSGAKTLPQLYFTSAEVFAQEQQKVFGNNWVLAAHASQLGEAGDYVVVELAGESLIILRDQASRIRTYY